MLKKYCPEILVFGIVFAILLIDLNPDYTFINKGADSIGYAYSAKYLYPSFHTSPPLYLLVSHFFLMIPFGTEAWRMALFSMLATMVTCGFIYLIIRKLLADKEKSKWFALLGVFLYGTSALVISQSIIIETYAIVCMFASGAFYFAITKHWKLSALFLGLGMVIHLLAFFVAFIMVLSFKEIRKNWKCWAIMIPILLFYLYIPITNRPPYMWIPDPVLVNDQLPKFLVSIYSVIVDTISVIGFLIGKLSIYDTPKRIFDIIGIVGVSIAVVGIVPLVYFFMKKHWYKDTLFWLIFTPIFIFLIELDPNTYDYCMVAMPFLAIAIVLGTNKLLENKKWAKRFVYVFGAFIVGFACFNAQFFDIGRTLDKNLGASNLYYNEFAKVPDGAILMPNYTWEWEGIFKYNRDYNKNLIPVGIDILPSHEYCLSLQQQGVKLIENNNENMSVRSREIAKSIIELNDNVWVTVTVDPRTFSSKVVQANHDTSLVEIYDIQKMENLAKNPTVQWKPYNPYDWYTTAIMIQSWNYVLMSNHNISRLILYTVLAYGFVYMIFRMRKNNKKVEMNN